MYNLVGIPWNHPKVPAVLWAGGFSWKTGPIPHDIVNFESILRISHLYFVTDETNDIYWLRINFESRKKRKILGYDRLKQLDRSQVFHPFPPGTAKSRHTCFAALVSWIIRTSDAI